MRMFRRFYQNCTECAQCVPYVGLCGRTSSGVATKLRLCEEERAKYRWWEHLFLLTARRCGPDARYFKPYPAKDE